MNSNASARAVSWSFAARSGALRILGFLGCILLEHEVRLLERTPRQIAKRAAILGRGELG